MSETAANEPLMLEPPNVARRKPSAWLILLLAWVGAQGLSLLAGAAAGFVAPARPWLPQVVFKVFLLLLHDV